MLLIKKAELVIPRVSVKIYFSTKCWERSSACRSACQK